jgi:hypothetical protein
MIDPQRLGWSVLGAAGGRGISEPSAAIFWKCRDHQAAYSQATASVLLT